jgi:hypothetical protein
MSELTECMSLTRWKSMNIDRMPELALLFHVPNETFTTSKTAKEKAVMMGVVKGVSDYILLHSSHDRKYHALVIEMKYGKNKPTEDQMEFIARAVFAGNNAAICYGVKEAAIKICDHLGYTYEVHYEWVYPDVKGTYFKDRERADEEIENRSK